MSHHAEHDTGDYEAARRSRNRKQTVAGVTGLAAILGAAAFLITEHVTDQGTVATDAGVLAPMVPPTPAATPAAPAPSATRSAKPSGAAPRSSPTPSATVLSKRVAREITDARNRAARDGVPLRRPLQQAPAAADVMVTNTGSLAKDRGTLRVVSAHADLTGQRELAWAADRGEPYGGARCTQNFKFSNNAEPSHKPNLLVCWRTSAGKSVVTVMVNLDGHPSKADSITALDREWTRLG